MKKRILSLLVAAVLVLGSAACSNNSNEDNSDNTESVNSEISRDAETADTSGTTGTAGSNADSAITDPSALESGNSAPITPNEETTEENPNNKVSIQFVNQNTDIIRQDNDGYRRLVYIKITNTQSVAMNNCYLYYNENNTTIAREIGQIYLNKKYTYETFWMDSSFSGNLPATLKNEDGTALWEGTITIQPSSNEYTIPQSYCYSLSDIKPMTLRGTNYFNRYQCWGKDWRQDDFTSEWDSDFRDMTSLLNINSVRAFTLLDDTLLYDGQVPNSETIIKIGRFLEIANKYNVKVILCLFGGDPVLSANMGDNLRFLRGVVEPFQNDGRVLMWDLINEPDADTWRGMLSKGLSEGGYLDTFVKTMYPKLKDEIDPNHMTCIGTAYKLYELQDIGVTPQIGSYHGYIQSDIPAKKVLEGWTEAADQYFNGKTGPFMMEEWGFSSEDAQGVEDEAYQLKAYQGYIPALLQLYTEGYNILGSYQWCAYDYPSATNIVVVERKNGLIREDGTLKPAGEYLAETYLSLKQSNPAPWE